MYPDDFKTDQLVEHVEDLLERFGNRALGDTIFRVGCDLHRKLAMDDRLMAPIMAGIRLQLPFDLILEAWMKACFFDAKNENGEQLKGDLDFKQKYGRDFHQILQEHCKISPDKLPQLMIEIDRIKKITK